MAHIYVYSPAGAVRDRAAFRRGIKQLQALGHEVEIDLDALSSWQRFAGDDATRLAAIGRAAASRADVTLISRGGYGLTRLLPHMPWRDLARSVERGTRWVGFSDLTALQLALLAHTGAPSWAGPTAVEDFGRADADGGVDDVTAGTFCEAMRGELHAVGWRTEAGFDGLQRRGLLWGGNLTVLLSLLGTPHWPAVRGGVLFLEDVNEQPYRVERMLLQLLQAGVIDAQRAVLLGSFTAAAKSVLDRGYSLKAAVAQLRARTKVPIVTGLPFGHVRTKLTLPVGRPVELLVSGRDAYLGWAHG